MIRNTVHVVFAAMLWVVFAYYWFLVGQRPVNPGSQTAIVVLGILALLAVLFVTLWILHNIRIFRKMQRRMARRTPVEPPKHDFLGRTFVAESQSELKRASYIEVQIRETTVDGKKVEEKLFRTTRRLR